MNDPSRRDEPDARRSTPLTNTGLLVGLQLLCAATMASLPSLFLHAPQWQVPPNALVPAALFATSYLICAWVLASRERCGRSSSFGSLLVLLAVAYAPSLLVLALSKYDVARRITVVQLGLGALLVFATAWMRRSTALRTGLLAAVAAAGLAIHVPFAIKREPPPVPPSVNVWLVNSTLHPLAVTEYRTWFDKPKVAGGGMTAVGDRFLLATGDGDLYLIAESKSGPALEVQRVPYHVPIDSAAFTAAVGERVDTTPFRVADVLVQETNGRTRLFATHHYWKADGKCFVVRVSMLESSDSTFLTRSQPGLHWRTIYETAPCVPIDFPGHPPHFGGIQIGGRLAMLSPHELLVALGDNELDGLNSPLSAPQDLKSSYGKTVLIDLEDLSAHYYSIGHRNPQGLFADGAGTIWLTEHGPQGGDELNLLQRESNYGWPRETYGVQYGTHAWPFAAVPGSHDTYTEPYYAWIPSIGVSSLLVSNSRLFKLWRGDLLVSSLKDKSIYRLRIRLSRVVMMERIPIGERIRDINEGHGGELLLWTDSGALLVVRVDNEVGEGESVFHICSGCHVIDNGDQHGFGPDLFHVVNRAVGSAPGFHYSPAMQKLGGKWTTERLDAFLRNPQEYVPGTAMRFPGVTDALQRAELIRYLAASANRPRKQPRQN